MRTTAFRTSFSSSPTPPLVRYLIWISAACSLFSALLDTLFGRFGSWTGIQATLSLSWKGLSKGWIWQPLTHLLVMQPYGGVSFGFLLSLGFQMYLLWFLGSYLSARFSPASFLRLYLISGALSSLAAVWTSSWLPHHPPLAGCAASLYAIFVVWTMLNPKSELFLFFVIPIQTKWLLAGALGATLFINLSEGDLVGLVWVLSGVLSGYLYGSFWHGLQTPFEQTHRIDQKLASWGASFKGLFEKPPGKSKIFDLKTGKPLISDEEERFVNEMLEKISKKGEASLSWWEKRKLNRIAKKKHKKK